MAFFFLTKSVKLGFGLNPGFPHSSGGKESACSAETQVRSPGSGISPGEGNGNPLQFFCLENPMDRGTWQAAVFGVARVGHDSATKPPDFFKCRKLP